jgi:hypothetical protein
MDANDFLQSLRDSSEDARKYFEELRKTAVSQEWVKQHVRSGVQNVGAEGDWNRLQGFKERMSDRKTRMYNKYVQSGDHRQLSQASRAATAYAHTPGTAVPPSVMRPGTAVGGAGGGSGAGTVAGRAPSAVRNAAKAAPGAAAAAKATPGMSMGAKALGAAGVATAAYGAYKALRRPKPQPQQQPAPQQMKAASVRDVLSDAAKAAKSHKAEIAGGVLGAVGGTLAMRAGAKPSKKTGKSPFQKAVGEVAEKNRQSEQEEAVAGEQPGFTRKMIRSLDPSSQRMADVLAQHPTKGGATLGAASGAASGIFLAKLLKNLSK